MPLGHWLHNTFCRLSGDQTGCSEWVLRPPSQRRINDDISAWN
jgi:hypothetical protein